MKYDRLLAVVLLLLVAQGTVNAQIRHQAQKHGFSMRMWINNVGAMGRVAVPPFRPTPGPPLDSLGLEYPIGQPVEHLFGGGLWIGGLLDTARVGTSPQLRLVTVTYEGWAGPYYEMFPGSTPEDTLYILHNASRHDTVEPPGWHAYWGGALPFRPVSDHDIYYTYTDTVLRPYGHVPLRLKVIQSALAWNEPTGEAITIVQYKLMNMGYKRIDSMYFGFFAETDVGPISSPQYWIRNYSGYYSAIRTAYTHNPFDFGSTPVGVRLLGLSQPIERITFRWFPGSTTPPTDEGKYTWLSSGVILPDEYPNLSDTRFVLAAGPYTMRPAAGPSPDTLIVTFAVVSGISLTSLYQNAVRADSLYRRFLTSVELPKGTLPERFALYQNYPNPFNPSTRIRYEVPHSAMVTLKVYNVLGQEVATLVEGIAQPGRYEVVWDATGLPGGVYVCRLQGGEMTLDRKMIFVK